MAVTIVCLDPDNKCTFDGNNDKRIVTIETGSTLTTSFRRILVTRGYNDGNVGYGGGMNVKGSVVEYYECDFISNSARNWGGGGNDGGGLYLMYSRVTLVDCKLESNFALGDGGAIYANGTPKHCLIDIYGTIFVDNTAGTSASSNIYQTNSKVIVHETCPPGYDGSQVLREQALETYDDLEGSLFSYSGCTVCQKGKNFIFYFQDTCFKLLISYPVFHLLSLPQQPTPQLQARANAQRADLVQPSLTMAPTPHSTTKRGTACLVPRMSVSAIQGHS